MNKEYKITSGDSTVAEGIPDKRTAENIFWGRVRHDGSRGNEVVLYRNNRIVLKQVARYR